MIDINKLKLNMKIDIGKFDSSISLIEISLYFYFKNILNKIIYKNILINMDAMIKFIDLFAF